MGLRWMFSVMATAILLATPTWAGAQSESGEGEDPDDATEARDLRDQEARTLFKAATMAYSDGRFEDALDYFQRAYKLSDRPELLFNIGSAAERLGRDRQAVDAYRAYLEKVPDAGNRRFAEARIEHLSKRVEAQDAERGSGEGAEDAEDAEKTEVPSPREAAQASAAPAGQAADESAEAQARAGLVDEGESGSVVGEWWLWTSVGVVVVGAIVAGAVLASGGSGSGAAPTLTSDDGQVYEALRVRR